ncbi:hypothetical protein JCM19236_1970 [Vibrio sp. JCM 19236]|nr:hypothetical protein JCM19236_1970 [Vibrio sp. JCM 19236]
MLWKQTSAEVIELSGILDRNTILSCGNRPKHGLGILRG